MSINASVLYRQLSTRIRERREDLGLTQAQVASVAGVLRTSINNIEKNRQKPPLHVLYGIAEALGVEVPELLPSLPEVTKHALVSVDVGGEAHFAQPRTADVLRRTWADLAEEEGDEEEQA